MNTPETRTLGRYDYLSDDRLVEEASARGINPAMAIVIAERWASALAHGGKQYAFDFSSNKEI